MVYHSADKKIKFCRPLNKDIKCDVLIVGGGLSGIIAATEFLKKGLHVVMIEENIIGGSSTGKSAGFPTPRAVAASRIDEN